ncbi:MAG: hypothetical protein ACRDZ6_03685 [Acidimicrobiales bacterium]
MGWVIWRHHRVALAGVAAFLGALACWLWIEGLSLHHAYATAVACHPAGSAACFNLVVTFENANLLLKSGLVLQPVPALIGAFVGPLLLAREFETGTFRYAWTQAYGRWRWALAKLVALGITLAVLAGAFSVLVSWYYQPYFAAGNHSSFSTPSELSPGLFDLRGIDFAAWTLAAFAVGVLAGTLIRRIVPAIVATLTVYAGLAIIAASVLREHYLTALVAKDSNIPGTALILSEWWTRGGKFAFGGEIPFNLLTRLCPAAFVGSGQGVSTSGALSPTQCLLQHGYTELANFQPASHFWPFQWIEGGWLLGLSTLLFAVTIWLVRRQAA